MINEASALNTVLVGVSVDSVSDAKETLKAVTRRHAGAADLTLLSDAGAAVVSRYGLLNPRYGVAHPAMYLIDRKGIVSWRYVSGHYTERASNAQVMRAIEAHGR